MTDLDPALKSAVEGLADPLAEVAKTASPIHPVAQKVVAKLQDIYGDDAVEIMDALFGVLMAEWLATTVLRTPDGAHPAILINAKRHVDDVLARLLRGESLRRQIGLKEKG